MLRGVNLSGLEFTGAVIPGTFGKDFFAPLEEDLQYYADIGFRLFRIPFRMSRYLTDRNTFDNLLRIVEWCASAGITVVLDDHSYGKQPYPSEVMVDTLELADAWRGVARSFRDYDNVAFGIQNEPIGPLPEWYKRAQASIDAIRSVGAYQPVLLANTGGQAMYWVKNENNAGAYYPRIIDSAYNTIYEVHTYFDQTHEGKSGTVNATIGRQRTQPFIDWCRHWRVLGFIGEFAGSKALDKGPGLEALRDYLAFMRENEDVLWGYAVWGGGRFWGDAYHFKLNPTKAAPTVEQPQIAVLREDIQSE